MPELMTEAIKDNDVTEIVTALRELATAGAPLRPNDPAELEIRAMLGLSPPPDEPPLEPEEEEDEEDEEDEEFDEDEDVEELDEEEEEA